MDLSVGDVFQGITQVVAGAVATWGALSIRLRALEDKHMATSKSQGERIGALEDKVAELRGFVRADARHRRKTKPAGEAP